MALPISTTRQQRRCSSCAATPCLPGTENGIYPCNLALRAASPQSVYLKNLPVHLLPYTSSLPFSHSLFQQEADLVPMADYFPAWQMREKIRSRRYSRILLETTVFSLISKCPDHKPADKTLQGFQSPV